MRSLCIRVEDVVVVDVCGGSEEMIVPVCAFGSSELVFDARDDSCAAEDGVAAVDCCSSVDGGYLTKKFLRFG